MKKISVFLVLPCFFLTSILGQGFVCAQELILSASGQGVALSPPSCSAVLKGIQLDRHDPLKIRFFIDAADPFSLGKNNVDGDLEPLKTESAKLIKSFLESIALPENERFGNLASHVAPLLDSAKGGLGEEFFQKVFARAQTQYGMARIPMDLLQKVRVLPDKAVVYANRDTAFVLENHLKISLEEAPIPAAPRDKSDSLNVEAFREIVIPALTKEINEGKKFFQLRQLLNSLVLAAWYRKKIQGSFLDNIYSNTKKQGSKTVPGSSSGGPIDKENASSSSAGEMMPGEYLFGGNRAEHGSFDVSVLGPHEISSHSMKLAGALYEVDSYMQLKGNKIRMEVAFDENTPPEVLRDLAQETVRKLAGFDRARIARGSSHPYEPEKVNEYMEAGTLLYTIAGNRNTDDKTLELLAEARDKLGPGPIEPNVTFEDENIPKDLSFNTYLFTKVGTSLIEDSWEPFLPESEVLKLAGCDSDPHISTPLSGLNGYLLQLSFIRYVHMPPYILEKLLSGDIDAPVGLEREEINRIKRYIKKDIRINAATTYSLNPELLQKVLFDADLEVRIAGLFNRKIPLDLAVGELAKDWKDITQGVSVEKGSLFFGVLPEEMMEQIQSTFLGVDAASSIWQKKEGSSEKVYLNNARWKKITSDDILKAVGGDNFGEVRDYLDSLRGHCLDAFPPGHPLKTSFGEKVWEIFQRASTRSVSPKTFERLKQYSDRLLRKDHFETHPTGDSDADLNAAINEMITEKETAPSSGPAISASMDLVPAEGNKQVLKSEEKIGDFVDTVRIPGVTLTIVRMKSVSNQLSILESAS